MGERLFTFSVASPAAFIAVAAVSAAVVCAGSMWVVLWILGDEEETGTA